MAPASDDWRLVNSGWYVGLDSAPMNTIAATMTPTAAKTVITFWPVVKPARTEAARPRAVLRESREIGTSAIVRPTCP